MAGSISVLGLPTSTKTPGAYLAVILGGPGTSAGAAVNRVLLVGQYIPSNLTGASPAFTVTAGTATANQPVQLASSDDAKTKFGAGSELHLMAKAAFAGDPAAQLWALPLGAGTGQATGVITMTGSPTAALTARIYVCGRTCDVAIASADTVTTIATAIATAINQQTDWPVTAQFAVGVVTLSAKEVCLRGNRITFRAQLISGTSTVDAKAGALAATLSGSTLTLSGGAAVGTTYHLTSGATAESLTTALTNITAMRFHRIALAQDDATSLAAVATAVDAQAAISGGQLRQQWVACSVDTLANATTLATARNAARGQVAWHYATDVLPGEAAAQLATERLAGDAAAGGVLVGEATDPDANLCGLQLATVPAQAFISDQPTPTQIESALNNGLTPLAPKGLTGLVTVVRSITTRSLDAQSNPNYGVLDTPNVTVTDYVADRMQSEVASKMTGAKLADDDASGAGPKIPGVVTPTSMRSFLLGILKDEEAQGHITAVDAKASLLAVVRNPAVAGRLDAEIPIVPLPIFVVFGGNARQIAA